MKLTWSQRILPILFVVGAICWFVEHRKTMGPLGGLFAEFEQIERIRAAHTPRERELLIAQLEVMPERIHSFHSRWLNIYAVEPFECWTEDGYDPSRSPVPRDIQLLAAAVYGIAEIDDGGFTQFFSDSAGGYAPEMVEFFERSGNAEAAARIRKAMAFFGKDFPRSQEARKRIIDEYKGNADDALDPETSGEDESAALDRVTSDGWKMDELGNRWLREVCGIKDLRTPCPVVSNPAPAKP